MKKRIAAASFLAAGILAAGAALSAVTVSIKEPAAMETSALMPAPHFLDRPEGRIAYDDAGKGPLVVLVPGLGDIRAEYRNLAPKLVAAGYRVVSMDLRGHGQSSAAWSDYTSSAIGTDVLALVEKLNAGPATLVGTSMGAAAVAWSAAEAPELVANVVVIGPFVRDIPPTSWFGNLLQQAVIKTAFRGPWGPAMWGKFYGSLHGSKPADFEAYSRVLVANLKEPGRLDALNAMMAAKKADAEARLAEVKAPVLVVMGTVDPDFPDPAAEADTVARLLRGSVTMVDGAGHYPHVESPDLVAAAILGLIEPMGKM